MLSLVRIEVELTEEEFEKISNGEDFKKSIN